MMQQTPIQDRGFTTEHAPTLGMRLALLEPGTPVRLTQDGRDLEVTVQRFTRDGSWDHAALTVGYGPGRYNREVSAAGILGGLYALYA